MVNEWTSADLPAEFDDPRRPGRPWNPSPELMADLAAWLNEHHPKPAREVTRDDLPDFGAMGSVMARWKVSYGAVSDVFDAVVAHLNANGGLPAGDRDRDALTDQPDIQTVTIGALKYERDRWRRAHAIVEQERDQAREALDRACLQRNQARTERDEALEASSLFQRDVHEWRTRAEAAEARTAVSREQVEDELNTWSQPGMGRESLVNLVCRLFGVEAEPADPVTEKAREIAKGIGWDWDVLDDEYVDIMRSVSVHVLGQETDHE